MKTICLILLFALTVGAQQAEFETATGFSGQATRATGLKPTGPGWTVTNCTTAQINLILSAPLAVFSNSVWRLPTAAETSAWSAARDADLDGESLKVLKAAEIVQNQRLNAICQRIISINAQSTNALNPVIMTPAQFRQAVIDQYKALP